MRIMLVEDDSRLAHEIQDFLEKWGYDTVISEQFENILADFMAIHPQLILMDINLPYFDGYYWCNQIRRHSEVPIIYISSRNDDRDKIMAIAQGGDDYVEKPFRLELLRAKIEAILRRTYQYRVKERVYFNYEIAFDESNASLLFQNEEVELTKSERRILAKLVACRGDVVTREELMMELWSTDEYISDGSLTTVISRLRSKIKSVCGEELVYTKKGQGYFVK